jgi:phosphatidylglycerophosphatase A
LTKNKLAEPIATWFGCGYSPVAPGTAGAAAALAIAWALVTYAGWKPLWFAGLAIVVTVPGVWAAGATARARKVEDPGLVVVDEVVGLWLTLAGAPVLNWKTFVAGFLLFRLFDIWKPAPVRQLERIPGGLGIMADDLMAGVYGALVLFLAGCFNLY